jgi:hypothetical protein
VTPFVENDRSLGELDEHHAGDFMGAGTLLAAARDAGYGTAAIGKVGPTLVFDHTARDGASTLVFDDSTGAPDGIPIAPDVLPLLEKAGLAPRAPTRGSNGAAGDARMPGTLVPNVLQQAWLRAVAAQVVLPLFKQRGKPFLLVFWSRDPDGTQHNQGDGLGRLSPGINGPTSLAAARNADDALAGLLAALESLGLAGSTDVVVSADHGFSTISKESTTSPAARATYPDVPGGQLPPGFLALDLAGALAMQLFDPDDGYRPVASGTHSKRGNGLLAAASGGDLPRGPDGTPRVSVVVAANGGSDLVYLTDERARELAPRVVDALLQQDYVSGLFVDDDLGRFPGTLPLSSIGLKGSARTPVPAVVVSFRSFPAEPGCRRATLCAVEVADTTLQQGQGMHGSFSRADTANAMAALGPDFRRGLRDDLPASNADVGRTIAFLMGLEERMAATGPGRQTGRVLREALRGGRRPAVRRGVERSEPARGHSTVLVLQEVDGVRYFDAAGFAGRTVGLAP